MNTVKAIALTRRTFVGKVTFLLLNKLSRLVIYFLPRSKRLLISWLQSPSAVILEPKKIKSDTVSTIYFNWRLITLHYHTGFAIHQHECTMGLLSINLTFKFLKVM